VIDEKRLEEILNDRPGNLEWRELCRLARLGLWAEKHGIPALKQINYDGGDYYEAKPHKLPEIIPMMRDALAALPPAGSARPATPHF
jgi:hypothetical protein